LVVTWDGANCSNLQDGLREPGGFGNACPCSWHSCSFGAQQTESLAGRSSCFPLQVLPVFSAVCGFKVHSPRPPFSSCPRHSWLATSPDCPKLCIVERQTTRPLPHSTVTRPVGEASRFSIAARNSNGSRLQVEQTYKAVDATLDLRERQDEESLTPTGFPRDGILPRPKASPTLLATFDYHCWHPRPPGGQSLGCYHAYLRSVPYRISTMPRECGNRLVMHRRHRHRAQSVPL